jgi:hypothetical protein
LSASVKKPTIWIKRLRYNPNNVKLRTASYSYSMPCQEQLKKEKEREKENAEYNDIGTSGNLI